jgi:hypothetical protein
VSAPPPPPFQARDITRLSYNTNFFQPDVTFSDGFRSFKGRDKYKQDMWPRAALKQPKGVSRQQDYRDWGLDKAVAEAAADDSAAAAAMASRSSFPASRVQPCQAVLQ